MIMMVSISYCSFCKKVLLLCLLVLFSRCDYQLIGIRPVLSHIILSRAHVMLVFLWLPNLAYSDYEAFKALKAWFRSFGGQELPSSSMTRAKQVQALLSRPKMEAQ